MAAAEPLIDIDFAAGRRSQIHRYGALGASDESKCCRR